MKRLFLAIAVITSAFFSLPCQAQTITWATFNIRYDNPADQSNNWQFRKDTVTRFIQAQDMDIVGMQEVLHNQLEDLLQRLPGYKSIGVGRDDGKTKGEYAPILYKEDRFEVLDSNTFWLSQYPDSIGFIGWDGACAGGRDGRYDARRTLHCNSRPEILRLSRRLAGSCFGGVQNARAGERTLLHHGAAAGDRVRRFWFLGGQLSRRTLLPAY